MIRAGFRTLGFAATASLVSLAVGTTALAQQPAPAKPATPPAPAPAAPAPKAPAAQPAPAAAAPKAPAAQPAPAAAAPAAAAAAPPPAAPAPAAAPPPAAAPAAPAPAPAAAQPPPPLAPSPLEPAPPQYPGEPQYPPPAGYGTAGVYEPPPPPPHGPPGRRTSLVVLAYNTAAGLGATHDFAPDFSFLGFSFDWRASLTDNIWAGLSLDWQVLYSKQVSTLEVRNVTATGTLVTHLNVFPMLATGHYYLKTDPRDIRPYGGLGIGAYSVERRVDLGFWTLNDSSWHFGFAPEIGVVLPTGAAGVVVATKFNYAFPSDGWNEVMYFNFNLGVEL